MCCFHSTDSYDVIMFCSLLYMKGDSFNGITDSSNVPSVKYYVSLSAVAHCIGIDIYTLQGAHLHHCAPVCTGSDCTEFAFRILLLLLLCFAVSCMCVSLCVTVKIECVCAQLPVSVEIFFNTAYAPPPTHTHSAVFFSSR